MPAIAPWCVPSDKDSTMSMTSAVVNALIESIPDLVIAAVEHGHKTANEGPMEEIAPTGTLRVGLVFAPSMSTFFVLKGANGEARGVTADLAAALGKSLNMPVELTFYPNSGLATDAVEAGTVNVSFMPVDETRKQRIAFGPDYVRAESTYMVTAACAAQTVADVDKPGIRVIGIANTTTIRAAERALKNTTISAVPSVEEAVAMLRDGKADAFALSRDSLPTYVRQIPGSRMVDGAFQQIGIAIAVAKGKPAALAAITAFMEQAKQDGTVRQALDRAGFADPVAP
jgi:polar amino acid transport system substrate-binding protein